MADIKIVTSGSPLTHDLDGKSLHLLPFECTDYDGPARTSTYFCVEATSDKTESGAAIDQAFFRGRELRGTTLQLPADYTGLVLRQDEMQADEVEKSWSVHGSFRELHYWNRESNPCSNDRPAKWMEWIKLSTALHRPVLPEEFAKQTEGSATS